MSTIDQARLHVMNKYWSAANYLTIGQIYLPDLFTRESSAERATAPRSYQTALTWALGDISRPQLHLRPPESAHPGSRCGYDLPGRARTRWPCAARQCVSRRDIHRGVPTDHARCRRHTPPLSPVLNAWRGTKSCECSHTWLHSRGRGTRVRARPRFWRGL